MANYSTNYRRVSVWVSRRERPTDDQWTIYADYPNEDEARDAAIWAVNHDWPSAKVVITQVFHPAQADA